MNSKTLDIVVAGYIVRDNKVLLIHHRKLDKWLPVGGHIKKDETPDSALIREVGEELGEEFKAGIEFVHYPKPRRGNQKEYALPFYTNVHHITEDHLHYCLFYLLKSKTNKIKLNEEELIGYNWFKSSDLDKAYPKINKSDKETCLEAIHMVG